MKKIVFIIAILFTTVTVQAQEFGIGVHGGYLTELEGVGGGLDLNYDFNEKWGVAFGGTFAVDEDFGVRNKWFALDLNGRYYVVDKLYAFAGGEYLSITVKTLGLGGGSLESESEVSDSDFGVNLGTGYRYNIIDNVNLYAEIKYVLLDAGYVHAKAGIHFSF
ncbi:outer membrane beta-barrel protein [Marinirhabdus gelatinilytica]|uniref:Outer membrane protein with beta-barrel domain n=1 Tax=Marinirhabdus gelatinilytica TaxID=1703343 RepID=A0A370QAG3_9FLAO|nr:outer membrane beta-barrel protein [Marinirhabdus gelatinilytica]RDK85347.1 outer membrane protein with beta-barrel domain [Marinirhabdus gelatinilytica]